MNRDSYDWLDAAWEEARRTGACPLCGPGPEPEPESKVVKGLRALTEKQEATIRDLAGKEKTACEKVVRLEAQRGSAVEDARISEQARGKAEKRAGRTEKELEDLKAMILKVLVQFVKTAERTDKATIKELVDMVKVGEEIEAAAQ